MNWNDVAVWCLEHICFERQRCGSCGCKGRKACYNGQTLAQTCERLERDGGTVQDMESVLKFVRSKCCGMSRSGQECNHRGCIRAERVVGWIAERIYASGKAEAA
jgi:hypothetical protein